MGFKPRRKVHDFAYCNSNDRFECSRCYKTFCRCASTAVYVQGKNLTLVCSGCYDEMNRGEPQNSDNHVMTHVSREQA